MAEMHQKLTTKILQRCGTNNGNLFKRLDIIAVKTAELVESHVQNDQRNFFEGVGRQ